MSAADLFSYFLPGQLVWVERVDSPALAGTIQRPLEQQSQWLVRIVDESRDESVHFRRLRPRRRFDIAITAAAEQVDLAAAPQPDSVETIAKLGALCTDSSDDEEQTEEAKVLAVKVEAVLMQFSLSKALLAAAKVWVKQMADPVKGLDLERVRMWLIHQLQGRRRSPPANPWQQGCPEIFPRLRALPWWSRYELPWLAELEASWQLVRAEVLALRGGGYFQPYRAPSWAGGTTAEDGIGKVSHDRGDWNVYYLELHGLGKLTAENAARCPQTVALLQKVVPRYYGHAFFSALAPKTHITKHNGPTNKKLRVHLPILGTEGSRLRCAGETKDVKAGEAMVFDDSFEHEAWHDGVETRITLIVDIWHPDLSDREIKFLGTLQRARMKAEQARAEKFPVGNDEDDFFSLLDKTKNLRKDDKSWWTIKS